MVQAQPALLGQHLLHPMLSSAKSGPSSGHSLCSTQRKGLHSHTPFRHIQDSQESLKISLAPFVLQGVPRSEK